jgi:hypothetical protein
MSWFSSTSGPDLNRVTAAQRTVNAGSASFALADVSHDSGDNEFYIGTIRRSNVTAYLTPAQRMAFPAYDPTAINNQLSAGRRDALGLPAAGGGSASTVENFVAGVADDLRLSNPQGVASNLVKAFYVVSVLVTLYFAWQIVKSWRGKA